jgi:hypothetical protein
MAIGAGVQPAPCGNRAGVVASGLPILGSAKPAHEAARTERKAAAPAIG